MFFPPSLQLDFVRILLTPTQFFFPMLLAIIMNLARLSPKNVAEQVKWKLGEGGLERVVKYRVTTDDVKLEY